MYAIKGVDTRAGEAYIVASTGPSEVSMAIPEFDIFSESDAGVRWIESVSDLATVKTRLEKIAADNPGMYFAFSSTTHSVVARIDSTAKLFKYQRPHSKAKDAA